jgi:predicted TIM-barrel fold metal-dependent hydrolase
VTRLGALLLALLVSSCKCAGTVPERYRKIDVHTHFSPAAAPRALQLMDAWGIDTAVDLSGGWPGHGLEETLAMARATPQRVVIFASPPIGHQRGADWSEALVRGLEEAHRQGARGVKIYKALGLTARDENGQLIAVDDPRLDALFERAGSLGMPVSIHTGDPTAFWKPSTPDNERSDELSVHPGWSYFGRQVPSWEELFQAYERRVARHPHTTIIGVHFGNAPEDPQRVAAMLEKYPNLLVDTAARVPELGRRDAATMRALFVRYQDRILFGTDLGVGESAHDLMLGSTGATAPGPADIERFFRSTWRYFETQDTQFESPTPIQGRWRIDGLGLPPEVLRKVYADNARRVLGLE